MLVEHSKHKRRKRKVRRMSKNSQSIRWIVCGNIVQPTGNPFSPEQQKEWLERQALDDDDVLWLGPGLKILRDHVITVNHNGVIRDVQPRRSSTILLSDLPPDCQLIQLQEPYEFLCPGMIDLHIHAPQFAYTGTATDRPLMGPDGWLEMYTFPAERRLHDDLNLARSVYQAVVQTTLRHGTTTAVYFATLHLEPCRVLVDTVLEQGQRALIGKVCMDRNSPADYCQTTRQNLEEAKQLIHYIYQLAGRRMEQQNENQALLPRVLPLITPRFIPTCTPELLTALGNLAREENCHITSHISESLDEVAFTRQLHLAEATGVDKNSNDVTDSTIFHSHHLLTDQCIMAHGVWLAESDLALLQQQGTAVAHCPLSNFFFANGILQCKKLLTRGNLVGLGTDVAGGYAPSMLDSSRMAVVAACALEQQQEKEQTDFARLDYRHAFYLATLGGAEALKLQDHLGNFVVGKQFDAFVFALRHERNGNIPKFPQDTLEDIFQKLCNLGDDRNVIRVFVAGQEVTASIH